MDTGCKFRQFVLKSMVDKRLIKIYCYISRGNDKKLVGLLLSLYFPMYWYSYRDMSWCTGRACEDSTRH